MKRKIWLLFLTALLSWTHSGAQALPDSFNLPIGRFENWRTVGSNGIRSSLWEILNSGKQKTVKAPDSSTVTIAPLPRGGMKVALWKSGLLLQERHLKGREINGWFVRRRLLRVVPIPAILFLWQRQNARISLDANSRLQVMVRESGFAWVLLLLHAGSTHEYEVAFEPAKE